MSYHPTNDSTGKRDSVEPDGLPMDENGLIQTNLVKNPKRPTIRPKLVSKGVSVHRTIPAEKKGEPARVSGVTPLPPHPRVAASTDGFRYRVGKLQPNRASLYYPFSVKKEWLELEETSEDNVPPVEKCFEGRMDANGYPVVPNMKRATRLCQELFQHVLLPKFTTRTSNRVSNNSALTKMQDAVVTNCMCLIIIGTATHFEFESKSRASVEGWAIANPEDTEGHGLLIDIAKYLFKYLVPDQHSRLFVPATQRMVCSALGYILGTRSSHRMWSWEFIVENGHVNRIQQYLAGHNYQVARVMDQICRPGLALQYEKKKVVDHYITEDQALKMFTGCVGHRCFIDDEGGVSNI